MPVERLTTPCTGHSLAASVVYILWCRNSGLLRIARPAGASLPGFSGVGIATGCLQGSNKYL